MNALKRQRISVSDVTLEVVEAGEGPLVVLVHGFPELALSWRAQIPALAAAGFRVLAPDMRGYGGSDAPTAVSAYGMLSLVGDLVGLVREAGADRAMIVGHDFGAAVSWTAALLRPDLFEAVACLSVPFNAWRAGPPPLSMLKALSVATGKGDFYFNRFQDETTPKELGADVALTLRRVLVAYDGATPLDRRSDGFTPSGKGFLDALSEPGRLPPWLDAATFGLYVEAFERKGFDGPVNWYRNIDANHAALAFTRDARILQPAFFMTGEHDPVRAYPGRALERMAEFVPRLRPIQIEAGAGHWLQQERPDAVNAALIAFLKSV